MNYSQIYNQLIERAKGRVKTTSTYYETHHVMPDFMFGNRSRSGPKGHLPGDPNDPSNLVLLTAREHLIAHLLLAKIYKGTRYEWSTNSALAFFAKVNGSSHIRQANYRLTSWEYETARRLGLEAISKARKGKVPVVCAITGVSIGSVPKDHPKVKSGEWIHHSKGKVVCFERDTNEKVVLSVSEFNGNRDKYISATDKSGKSKGNCNPNYKPLDSELYDVCLNEVINNTDLRPDGTYRLKVTQYIKSVVGKVGEARPQWNPISEAWITKNIGKIASICEQASKLTGLTITPRDVSEKDGIDTRSKSKWIWVTDGKTNFRQKDSDPIPEGYKQGRTL